MAKKKVVVVSGGKGRGAPKYELRGEIFQGINHKGRVSSYSYFTTRAEWHKTLQHVFIDHLPSSTFRYYQGATTTEKQATQSIMGNGVLIIGCHKFNRTELRKIARWCGWSDWRLSEYLPVIKKQKQAQEAQ